MPGERVRVEVEDDEGFIQKKNPILLAPAQHQLTMLLLTAYLTFKK